MTLGSFNSAPNEAISSKARLVDGFVNSEMKQPVIQVWNKRQSATWVVSKVHVDLAVVGSVSEY